MKNSIHEKINFRAYLQNCSVEKSLYGQQFIVVDINRYGVWEYNSDPENCQIYRNSLYELFVDLYEYANK